MKKFLICLFVLTASYAAAQPRKTENVILITLDGLRWQELFNGADQTLMKQQKHLKDDRLEAKFWRPAADERRKALMPFMWTTIATQGQIYGNRAEGCKVDVTNTMLFSYPGYNEILTGAADDARVNSNDKRNNPNKNVLEVINSLPAYKGRVAAFSSWDVFPYIINAERSGVFVSTGERKVEGNKLTERELMMNDLINSIANPLPGVRPDAFTFYYGLEYMKKNKPKVMYFAFDETDDFAHGGEYGAYLNAAHYTDRFIAELWKYLQQEEQYRGKTTLIITTDHGRGTTEETWKDHGQKIPEASQIWLVVLGPDANPLGEVKQEMQLYQNQVAATVAALLGVDFSTGTAAGKAIKGMTARK